jgi:crossover junction endodeoxyribonuclease RusA
MTTFHLPIPPSTNNLFFNLPKGGRAPTGEYKQWQSHAGLILNRQGARPVKGPVRIDIKVCDAGRFDLDNTIKPTLDLLKKHGVIEDDNRQVVRGLSADWSDDIEGIQVRVTSMEIMGAK